MPYVRPSYTELQARITADLSLVPAVLRDRLAASWAQACHGEHGHLDWIDRQCSPLTCDEERLVDWAALYRVDRLATTTATGSATATGNAGTQLLAGTLLRGQNGLDYTVTAATTLVAGGTAVPLRCATSGGAGNMQAGQTLTLIDPVPGCDSTLTTGAAGMTGGAEQELLELWRARLADEWQVVTSRGARSGKDDDYRYWARQAHPSVTTALVQRHVLGWGTIIVRPICDTLLDRLPTQAVLDAVAARLLDIAPAGADWRVTAPIKRLVTAGIKLNVAVDTANTRAAIDAACRAAVMVEATETAVLQMAELDAAIATVTTQYLRTAPVADVAVAPGEVLVWGGVVWG